MPASHGLTPQNPLEIMDSRKHAAGEDAMEKNFKCGMSRVEHADIAGSRFTDANMEGAEFHDVNLAGADFDNVSLSGARFHNADMSDIRLSAVQIGGASFGCIGTPPDSEGHQARQRAVVFENAMLCDSLFRRVDLSGSRIEECDLTGATIDGIPVADLLEAWKAGR